MPKVLITPAAEDDLADIYIFIAQENRLAAEQVLKAVQETFFLLAATPAIGSLFRAKRAALKGIRFFPIKQYDNYLIYYRATTKGVEVIRLLHGRMDRDKRI